MPPTFTTVDNVVFDFGARIISVPANVAAIDSQWLVDHCRLAEESPVGVARPSIVEGSGKVTIDQDINGNPIRTGVVAILKSWKLQTLRSTGSFTIKDIYMADNSIPYVEPSPVPVRYQQTVGGVLLQDTSAGGSGATLAQIESSAVLAKQDGLNVLLSRLTELRASVLDRDIAEKADVSDIPSAVDAQLLDNFAAMIGAIMGLPTPASPSAVAELKALVDEIYLLHGLKVGLPLVVTDTQRTAGSITQSIASTPTQTTVTRQ